MSAASLDKSGNCPTVSSVSTTGTYHRLGEPGGPGCGVATLPMKGRSSEGKTISGVLADAGPDSTELEMLRTIAAGLGVRWGHDEFGWWAAVPDHPVSAFASTDVVTSGEAMEHQLFREDDNGVRFLIDRFPSREEAEERLRYLAHGGHKQHYFIELVRAAAGSEGS